jgi:uncharacterized phage protein (TIGR01671 family)
MTKIKFRGKRTDGKGWWYGYVYSAILNLEERFYIKSLVGVFEVEKDTVGQFTGLLDKNGKEIYEGDVLSVGENLTCSIVFIDKNSEDYGDEIHGAFHAHVFKHNKQIPLDSYLLNNCYIVGNIFDNPNLLTND